MRYNHLVEIEQPTNTELDNGGYSQSWSVFKKCYVTIEALSGREFMQGGAIENIYTHRIRLLPIPNIEPNMRIKFYDGYLKKYRYFNIIFIRDIENKHRELQLTCEERTYEQD